LVNRQFLGANVANTGDTQLPVNSREAKTKVLVRNGQTAVIGGIYQSDATESANGVPWFKDVPVLGSLFKSTDKTKNKVELLIFLTPRILGQNETNSTPTSAKDF
jgi:type IV pilus assembly protein PilQ